MGVLPLLSTGTPPGCYGLFPGLGSRSVWERNKDQEPCRWKVPLKPDGLPCHRVILPSSSIRCPAPAPLPFVRGPPLHSYCGQNHERSLPHQRNKFPANNPLLPPSPPYHTHDRQRDGLFLWPDRNEVRVGYNGHVPIN